MIYLNGAPIIYASDRQQKHPEGFNFACHSPSVAAACAFDNVRFWRLPESEAGPDMYANLGADADEARAFAEPILVAISERSPDF